MVEQIVNAVASVVVEVIVVAIGSLLIALLNKAQKYLANLKKKDELGIIDTVTDRVVEYAEAQLKGKAGQEKLDFAVSEAVKILASKGLVVHESEIKAGIENGVNKLKAQQQFLAPLGTLDNGVFIGK
jgi:hypothetical protein